MALGVWALGFGVLGVEGSGLAGCSDVSCLGV